MNMPRAHRPGMIGSLVAAGLHASVALVFLGFAALESTMVGVDSAWDLADVTFYATFLVRLAVSVIVLAVGGKKSRTALRACWSMLALDAILLGVLLGGPPLPFLIVDLLALVPFYVTFKRRDSDGGRGEHR